jgi:hypothetical protein
MTPRPARGPLGLVLVLFATAAFAQAPPAARPTAPEARGTAVGAGPDAAPDDPPAPPAGPPAAGGRSYGPPPPPRLAAEGWFIGPSRVEGTDASLGLSFFSIGGGRRWTFDDRTAVSVRPQFQTLFLSGPGPTGPDLPAQVYGLTVDLQVERPISRRWSLLAAATPGLYTDFEDVRGESVRVPARLFGTYVFGPKLTAIGGVVYTAQPDLPIIPAAGVIWMPSKAWRVEGVMPRPRVVYRWSDTTQLYGLLALDSSTYAIGEGATRDLFQYRDWRAALGVEYGKAGSLRVFTEVGAAFARRLELEAFPDHDLEPGFFLRAGLRY